MMTPGLYSSSKTEWETPQELFDDLDREFHFTLDPCASPGNAKCDKFYTPEHDGLLQSWDGERVFMNPPYGREVGKWIKKASEICNGFVVALLPARTDTRWYHDYIQGKASVTFLKGRVRFVTAADTRNTAPFPSMIALFHSAKLMKGEA